MNPDSTRDLAGKVYVVTGANSGIGRAAATNFASRGAQLVMVCRSTELGIKALDAIRRESNNPDLKLFIADFRSLESVNKMAQELIESCPKIDVLCNNAGGANAGRRVTSEGFETTFAVNHLAGFLLTQRLLPALLEAADSGLARVVFTSSLGHTNSPLDFADLNLEKGYSTLKAYGRSKLMNLLLARELQRRFGDRNLVASSFHPGAVRTPIWRKGGFLAALLGLVMYPFMRSIDKGAQTLIWLAASSDAVAVHAAGNYFIDCKQRRPAEFATDEAAEQLWRISEELVRPFTSPTV
ncbi:MAG: SDR family oxidoreductase [Proteobacteria bacterium]|nr:SDR family oxidoreductase [Pseudomonadota bacterium]